MSSVAKPVTIQTKPRLRLAERVAAPAPLACEDVLTGAELARAEIEALFDLADEFKAAPMAHAGALAGKSVVLLFEKPSLRTRVTFEVALHRLGAQAIYLDHQQTKIGQREPILDYGKNLERWCHAIVGRVDSHETLVTLADHAAIPVVNALCDRFHPCQALADFLTLRQRFGSLDGLRLAYVGDGNNVCHSLLLLGARLGVNIVVATPPGMGPEPEIVQQASAIASLTGGWIDVTTDLRAVAGADAIYTDTWASMGVASTPDRARALQPYQVNESLMAAASPDAVFMHCLPAHRGEEVAPEVIDSPRSLIYDQAENRLHAQQALLLRLMAAPITA